MIFVSYRNSSEQNFNTRPAYRVKKLKQLFTEKKTTNSSNYKNYNISLSLQIFIKTNLKSIPLIKHVSSYFRFLLHNKRKIIN